MQQETWYGNCDFADSWGKDVRCLGYGLDPVRVESKDHVL